MTNISKEQNASYTTIAKLLERASKDPVIIDVTAFFEGEIHQLVIMPNVPHRANIWKSKTNEIVQRFDLSDSAEQDRFLEFFKVKDK